MGPQPFCRHDRRDLPVYHVRLENFRLENTHPSGVIDLHFALPAPVVQQTTLQRDPDLLTQPRSTSSTSFPSSRRLRGGRSIQMFLPLFTLGTSSAWRAHSGGPICGMGRHGEPFTGSLSRSFPLANATTVYFDSPYLLNNEGGIVTDKTLTVWLAEVFDTLLKTCR